MHPLGAQITGRPLGTAPLPLLLVVPLLRWLPMVLSLAWRLLLLGPVVMWQRSRCGLRFMPLALHCCVASPWLLSARVMALAMLLLLLLRRLLWVLLLRVRGGCRCSRL